MRVSTWIIFAIFFAFTESVPITNENQSRTYNFTKEIKVDLSTFFRIANSNKTFFENDHVVKFGNYTNRGVLYNVTYEFILQLPSKFKFISSDCIRIYGELPLTYLKGRVRDTRVLINTHWISIDYIVNQSLSSDDNFTATYRDFNPDSINRIWNRYIEDEEIENDMNLEMQIKQEIEINVKHGVHEIINKNKLGRNKFSPWFLKNYGQFLHNKEERYYFIDTIKATNFTLYNVTLTGLWNVEAITLNMMKKEIFPDIEMSSVKGTLQMHNFTTPQENSVLNFQSDHIYIYLDQYLNEINVRIEKSPVINTETSKSLKDDQQKSIFEQIESSIANSIHSYWKNGTP